MRNLYQLFGVGNFVSFEEIAAAYKKKHAELFNSDSPLANIPKLRELMEAFEIFSDDDKRAQYDDKLAAFLEELHEKYEEAVEDLSENRLQDALDKIRWCMSKDPGEPDYYETVGLIYRLDNDYDNAIRNFKQGLQTGQRMPWFHRALADVYQLKHDEENADTHYLEAAEGFKEILKTDPRNIEALETLADIYCKIKFHDEAIDLYRQLLLRFPYNASYHRDLGAVLYEVDHLEEAEVHLLEALRIAPGSSACLLFLGLVYFKRRLLAMAVQTLRDSLKHAPDQPEVKQLIVQIEAIRSEIGKTIEEIIYDPTPDAHVEGLVKWYNPETGMGMLSCEEYPEVLLHYTAIKNESEISLNRGDPVRFGVVKDSMSPIAVQVEKLDESPVYDAVPGKIFKFDADKKVGLIKTYDDKQVMFAWSALSEEVIDALSVGLDVLVESRTISGLSDDHHEQAVRVRLRKRMLPPKN